MKILLHGCQVGYSYYLKEVVRQARGRGVSAQWSIILYSNADALLKGRADGKGGLSADDLPLLGAEVDLEDEELVGLGVVERLEDLGHAELDLGEIVEGDEAGSGLRGGGQLGGRAGSRLSGGGFICGGRLVLHAMDLPLGLLYILLTLLW